ncbi:magnesium and cobalt transport protein CorA [Dermatophilus congolensis]|uniref:magnesium and cobalt transport protein CorA n=1 Tax=Dermatophilus congolensis TaxID=1863 RepID=UPI001FB8DDC7|nr:magnesium and cobalt transport protein CorA [Dermatophilus congolensis]
MTLVIVNQAYYRGGHRVDCDDPSTELRRLRTRTATPSDKPEEPLEDTAKEQSGNSEFAWIGLKDPSVEEFSAIAQELGLHPLAIEDALTARERPKIDVFDDVTVLVLRTLRYIDATSDVETGQLILFIGKDFVLTVRYGEVNELIGVRAALERLPQRMSLGPLAVVHGVLDRVVDNYMTIDTELAEDVNNIEELVFSSDGRADVTDIYRLKREVLEYKRASTPLVIPLYRLIRGSTGITLPQRLQPFFKDVEDHLLQVTEQVDGYDSQLSDLLSAHLSQVSLQQNEDQRKISAWAAIAVLPTLISSIYGMNYDNMPELHWQYGYYVTLAAIASTCIVLFIMFKRSGWL